LQESIPEARVYKQFLTSELYLRDLSGLKGKHPSKFYKECSDFTITLDFSYFGIICRSV